jgi:ectoine hydroxylase-related dioxygenase (phytanoyl-CoA dioxygenase family)
VNHLYKEDKAYTDILVIEPVKQILMSMLNDPYYPSIADGLPNYILGQYTARSSGARRLQLHIDSVIPAPGDRTWSAQVVYVLEDMSLETGSTQVIPGTHLSGKYTDRTLEPQSLVAHAGDVIIWDSRLWHGTNPNLTTRTRWVLIATVQAWWMKQKYEITSAIPNDLYARLSDEQKQVLGFCSMPPKVDGEYFDIKGGYERLV